MKLQLKKEEIIPYLVYDLKVMDLYDNKERFFVGYSINHTEPVKISVYKNLLSTGRLLSEVKPILRPLSSFEKKSCLELMKTFNCSMEIIHEVWKLIQGEIKLEDITLKTYNMMCKKHIDFKRLIEKGLAIDINTI